MKTSILLALGAAAWESRLVAAITRPDAGFVVVRRCTDLADLLGVAGTLSASLVLVGSDLPRLDRATVLRLEDLGLTVIGLHAADDESGAARLREVGCELLLGVGVEVEAVIADVAALFARRSLRLVAAPVDSPSRSQGQLVVVWGPVGAPGRSSVALSVADESARAGIDTLLVDADTAGPSLSALLGLCDDVPTFHSAVRRADRGSFGPADLSELVSRVGPRMKFLGGANTCGELRARALSAFWSAAAALHPMTIVDVGSETGAEDDELVGRRGSAAASAFCAADVIVAVGAADPIGLARLVSGLSCLRTFAPETPVRVVITKVRRDAVGPRPEIAIREALAEHLDEALWLVPDDRAAYDAAVLAGRTLAELAPNSPARRSLGDFTAALRADLLGQVVAEGVVAGRGRLVLPLPARSGAG